MIVISLINKWNMSFFDVAKHKFLMKQYPGSTAAHSPRFHIHSTDINWDIGWKRKLNQLIKPVNTRGTCSDKISYCNIWDSVLRGYIANFIFRALRLTNILAEIVKLTYKLILLTPGGHSKIKPITTISEKVFREPTYQN